jgi:cell division protein FtsN
MENENRRLAWIGGILILGVAVLLGWLLLTKQEKKPESLAAQPPVVDDTLATQRDLPVQEPPTQPPPQIVVDTEGKYTVQVSSWRTRRRAEQDAQRFSAQGFNAYVQSAYIPSMEGTWYRVRVGSYATSGEAKEMAARLAGLLESGYWVDRYKKEEPSQ